MERFVSLLIPLLLVLSCVLVQAGDDPPQDPDLDPILITITPAIVNEGESFIVTTMSIDGEPLEADVTFNNLHYSTSQSTGNVTIYAPQVTENTEFDVIASASGYDDCLETMTVLNVEDPQMFVTAPSTIPEGEQFSVSVIDSLGRHISGATVSLIKTIDADVGDQEVTDDLGVAVLTSPQVDADTDYTIRVEKTGYQNAFAYLIVLNQANPTQELSFMYGIVYNESAGTLEGVRLLFLTDEGDDIITGQGTYTNEDGIYSITLEPGTYTVELAKEGYIAQEHTVALNTTPLNQDFILEAIPKIDEPPEPEITDVVSYAINYLADDGVLGAQIETTPNLGVFVYNPDLTVEIIDPIMGEKVDSLSLYVSGSNLLEATFVAEVNALRDPKNIIVTIDGEEIPQVSFIEFFSEQDSIVAQYAPFIDPISNSSFVFIRTPLSEHTIKISSILPADIVHYSMLSIAAALVIIAVAGIMMFRKGKTET